MNRDDANEVDRIINADNKKINFTMQTQTKTMKELVQEKWNKRPLIISGPCSAETEEQVVETAIRLAKTGKVDILRAGIWKPRTKPGMFEGIGVKGWHG